MKKILFILFLALCLALPAGCASQGQTSAAPTAEPTSEPTVEPVAEEEGSPSDATQWIEDGSATDASMGWTGADLEECVEDLAPFEGMVPYIRLECPGAAEINDAIEAEFVPLADDPECEGMFYLSYKAAQRVLSVVMVVKGPNDTIFYTPYNLDLITGEALDGEALMALLGVDADELKALEQTVMGEEFTHEYGTGEAVTDEAFYAQQYERTTALENTQTDRLWVAGDGQLTFVGRIYSLAGAEYYERALGTGLIF